MGENMFSHSETAQYHRWSLAKATLVCAFCAAAVFTPGERVLAQSATENGTLEEIIVTSRRYEESIQDAPVAVGVMTAEYMQNNRITRADDLMEVSPGTTWESFSKMQPVASMRGIIAPTPGNASSEASIQTVHDNVVITKDSMKYPTMYDMARVEVMRGPQGTAFGRNASVGLIHFVSNRPSQNESGGRINATVGSDELFELDGFITGQFSDTVSARLAFNHDQQDGPTKSISTGNGLDGDENTALRASLVFEPSDTFSAYLKAEYSADRDQAPVRSAYYQPGSGLEYSTQAFVYSRTDINPVTGTPGAYNETFFRPDDPFLNEVSPGFDFHTDRDILTLAAELVWSLNNDLTITSITGYLDGDTDSLMDLVGTTNNVSFQQVQNDATSFSTELRLDNMASDNSIRWLGGIYLMTDEEDRFEQNIFQADGARLGPWVETHMGTVANNTTDSYSIFGELSWDIGDRTTLTYGGRFVDDSKDYLYGVRAWGTNKQIAGVPGVGPGVDGVAQVCPLAGPPNPTCGSAADPLGFENHPVSDSWSDYISKLSLSYQISDNLNIYGLYSEGFKSGTFQPDARNMSSADIVVEPESSWNFEVGLKGSAERFRYAITAFIMEVEDVQTINLVPVGAGFTGLISNVGRVETQGLEFEGTFLLGDNFLLGGTLGLIDAEMQDTPDPTGALDPDTGEVYSLNGHRPPGAPEWTYALYGEYTAQLGNGSRLLFRADVRSRSDVFNQTSNRFTTPPLRLRPEVTNWGARITWTSSSDKFSLSAWGKNLSEEVDVENFGPPSPCCSSFAAGFRGKTQYGLTGSFDFGG
jgi:iron complex outermembrane receptor protein